VSAALRQVFAEFGFKVDSAKLEELDKLVRDSADHMRDSAAAAIDFDKAFKGKGPKSAADALKAWGAEQKAAADKLKTLGGIAEKARDNFAAKLGASAAKSNPLIKSFADRLNLTDAELGKMVMGATAAAAAIIALGASMAFAFGAQFAANAEALRDTARESRVTTSELQGLDHAAVQAGVGVERMRSGLHTFGEALRQGERWGNGTTSTLRRLGITTRDANGHIRPTAELLDEVAVGMERIESPYRRARVAQQLFGESGRRMLDVLHTGPGGIRQLREELEELGGGVTPEAVEASRRFTQAQERQGRALDSLRSVLATTLLPALTWWLNLTARAEGLLARLTRGTHVAEVALGALGVVGVAVAAQIVAAWGPVVAPYLAAAVAVAALVAVFDDLITFVDGGDSAVGRFLDTTFGVGTAASVVKQLKADWESVVSVVERAIAAIARFIGIEQEAPALGTLRAPSYGARPGARGVPARASGPGAARSAAGAAGAPGRAVSVASGARAAGSTTAQVVPATQTVAAPAASVVTTTRTTSFTSAPELHFHGVTEAAMVTRMREEMRREQAAARDAAHPQEDD
jgi:hypothetical protein